jgi:hypothetical protein
MLDEDLRGRLHGLAAADESALDDAAQERILSLIREQGPAIVQGAKRRRTATAFVAFASAAAAAAALFAVRHATDVTTAKVESGSPGVGAACASRPVPASAQGGFITGSSGARLDLGAVALATATPGTSVRLEEASPCRTIIALDSGTVAVHAKDLGGGELRVRTTRGDVVVHGTIFAVTRDETSLAVEVVVGNVSVTDRADSHSVTTGQRLLLSAVGAAEGPLEEARAHAVRVALGVPDDAREASAEPVPERRRSVLTPPPQPGGGTPRTASSPVAHAEEGAKNALPVPQVTLEADEPAPAASPKAPNPPQDPLTLAEAARRAGDYAQARELYRRAGEGTGVTAEAALVALARMELSLGHSAAARDATKRRQERFGRGTLSPEALWIDVRSYRQSGDLTKARELANQLVQGWPSSPQARAAAQWLGAR